MSPSKARALTDEEVGRLPWWQQALAWLFRQNANTVTRLVCIVGAGYLVWWVMAKGAPVWIDHVNAGYKQAVDANAAALKQVTDTNTAALDRLSASIKADTELRRGQFDEQRQQLDRLLNILAARPIVAGQSPDKRER